MREFEGSFGPARSTVTNISQRAAIAAEAAAKEAATPEAKLGDKIDGDVKKESESPAA